MLPSSDTVNFTKDLYMDLKKKGRARVQFALEADPYDFDFHKAPPSCEVFVLSRVEGKQLTQINMLLTDRMSSEDRTIEIEVESILSTLQKFSNIFLKKKIKKKALNLIILAKPTERWEPYYRPYTCEKTMTSGEKHCLLISLKPIKSRG